MRPRDDSGGGFVGLEPEGFSHLIRAMRTAGEDLTSAGGQLQGILRSTGLSDADAREIEEIGRWATRQVPDLQRRLDLLMQLNQAPAQAGLPSPLMVTCGMRPPRTPSVADRAAYAVGRTIDLYSSYLGGVWDGTKGIATFAWKYGAIRPMVNPKGWATDIGQAVEGTATGIQHPIEFAKIILDVETWQKDPARAYGRLAPEAVLTALTGGAGLATKSRLAAQSAAKARLAARQVAKVKAEARAAAVARAARAERLKAGWRGGFDGLKDGRQKGEVKIVRSHEELRALFDDWVEAGHGRPLSSRPPKVAEIYKLADGTRIQWRVASRSGGETIDIVTPERIRRKVHIERGD